MPRSLILAAAASLVAGPALACASLEEAMAHFETVNAAYIENSGSLRVDQYPIYAGHVEAFGNAMQVQDFTAACQALDQAVIDLGFDVETVSTPTVPAAPAAPDVARTPATSGRPADSAGAAGTDTTPPPSPSTAEAPVAAPPAPAIVPVRTGRDRARPPRLW